MKVRTHKANTVSRVGRALKSVGLHRTIRGLQRVVLGPLQVQVRAQLGQDVLDSGVQVQLVQAHVALRSHDKEIRGQPFQQQQVLRARAECMQESTRVRARGERRIQAGVGGRGGHGYIVADVGLLDGPGRVQPDPVDGERAVEALVGQCALQQPCEPVRRLVARDRRLARSTRARMRSCQRAREAVNEHDNERERSGKSTGEA